MHALEGLLSGAAGTAALNTTTYLDIAVRGRPPSPLPKKAVEKMSERAGVELGEDEQAAKNRKSGLGALLGYATGLGVGLAYGVVRPHARDVPLPAAAVALGLGAMAATDTGNTLLGITDPTEWSASAWAADIVPHLAYGAVTALAYDRLADR